MPTSCSSRLSSTLISVAAMRSSVPSLAAERCVHDRLQVAGLALHLVAQVAEAEHAERIGDLLQQLELRRQLVDLRAALAHEDVERVLHAAEVFLDRRGDRLHQLDGRRRQALARLLDVIVDRQQLGQAERRAHGGDARPGAARARDVVQKIVEQLERRRIDVARLRPARTDASSRDRHGRAGA